MKDEAKRLAEARAAGRRAGLEEAAETLEEHGLKCWAAELRSLAAQSAPDRGHSRLADERQPAPGIVAEAQGLARDIIAFYGASGWRRDAEGRLVERLASIIAAYSERYDNLVAQVRACFDDKRPIDDDSAEDALLALLPPEERP